MYILVTGSKDKTCVIWYLKLNDNKDRTLLITPERILYGHRSEITCVCVSSELDLVVSGSFDGTCNIYTIEDGIYICALEAEIWICFTLHSSSPFLDPVYTLFFSVSLSFFKTLVSANLIIYFTKYY